MGQHAGTLLLALSLALAASRWTSAAEAAAGSGAGAVDDDPSPIRRRARERPSFRSRSETPSTVPRPDLSEMVRRTQGVDFCDVFLQLSCTSPVSGKDAPCELILPQAAADDECVTNLDVSVYAQNLAKEAVTVINMTVWLDDEAEVLVSDDPGRGTVEIPVGGDMTRDVTLTANVCDGGNRTLRAVVFGTYVSLFDDSECVSADEVSLNFPPPSCEDKPKRRFRRKWNEKKRKWKKKKCKWLANRGPNFRGNICEDTDLNANARCPHTCKGHCGGAFAVKSRG